MTSKGPEKHTNPQIEAVVDCLPHQSELLCPWAIADRKTDSFIRLSGKMTDREVGSVFIQLVSYNNLETEGDTNDLLHSIVQAQKLILPGGFQIRSAEKRISPGCCCGLETWRDWLSFLKTGASPWLGHDPSPWVEKMSGQVRLWSDRENRRSDKKAKPFHIDFEQTKFEMELSKVQQDLNEFLPRIEAWAGREGFSEPTKLSHKFDDCFNISHYR